MDPNLLPKDSRSIELSEQAKLKKVRAELGIDLNQPKSIKPTVKSKTGGFWKNLFGKPVSPIKDLVLTNPSSSKNEAPKPNLLSASKPIKVNPTPVVSKQPVVMAPVRPVEKPPIKSESKPHSKPHRDSKATTPINSVPKHEKSAEVNVNLMPTDLATRHQEDKAVDAKSVIIAVLAPVILVTICYAVVIMLQSDLKSRMTAKQTEFNNLEKQLGDFVKKENENNKIADRVGIIKQLSAEKVVWNNFFEKLEKYTLDGVYYNNLTTDTSGVMTLPGVADNYETLAKQLAVYKAATDFIKDAKLINAQLVSEGKAGIVGVGFQVRLTLQENLFKKVSQTQ